MRKVFKSAKRRLYEQAYKTGYKQAILLAEAKSYENLFYTFMDQELLSDEDDCWATLYDRSGKLLGKYSVMFDNMTPFDPNWENAYITLVLYSTRRIPKHTIDYERIVIDPEDIRTVKVEGETLRIQLKNRQTLILSDFGKKSGARLTSDDLQQIINAL